MNETRKVVSGEPLSIPANTWNKLIDLVEPGSRPGAETYGIGDYPSVLKVLVKYDTDVLSIGGYVFNRFDVIRLTGLNPFIKYADEESEFKQRPNFIANYVSSYRQQIGILLEPMEPGAIAWAAIAGIIPARIDIIDAGHTRAKPTEYTGGTFNKGHLTSSRNGPCQIIWKETGTGIKWGYVALPMMSHYIRMSGYTPSLYLDEIGSNELRFNSTDFKVSAPDYPSSDMGAFIVSANRTTTTTSSWMGF